MAPDDAAALRVADARGEVDAVTWEDPGVEAPAHFEAFSGPAARNTPAGTIDAPARDGQVTRFPKRAHEAGPFATGPREAALRPSLLAGEHRDACGVGFVADRHRR